MIQANVDRACGPSTISAATCAKINLTLDILGKRDDGYHELDSVVVGVGLYDDLTLEPTRGEGLGLICRSPGLETEDNLVLRALCLVRGTGVAGSGVCPNSHSTAVEDAWGFRLEKRIPVGGGLGGGSGNAAGALMLLNRAWNLGRSRQELSRSSSAIGSDVPLFFHLPAALVRGRGERVEPLSFAWSGWVLLVHAGGAVSTAAAYSSLRPEEYSPGAVSAAAEICRLTRAKEIMAICRNDLTSAIARVAPHVERVRCEIRDRGIASMVASGAGSVLFHLFDEKEAAQHAAGQIAEWNPTLTTYVVPAPVGLHLNS